MAGEVQMAQGVGGTLSEAAEGAAKAVEGAAKAVEGVVEKAAEGAVYAVEGAAKVVEGVVEAAVEAAAQSAAHSNLTTIAVVALVALLCGMGMERLRQPALVGYILSGVLLGPSAFALVENRSDIDSLAELGVLMLLFVVGMELSLRLFRRLWRLAVLAALCQIGASTGVMLLFWAFMDWPLGLSVLLGFVVAVSSTAVAIKVLEAGGELNTRSGRITVGVLIAQDLAVVPMMLTIAALGGDEFQWLSVVKIVGSIAFLASLIWYLSRGPKIDLPFAALVAGNTDLKPLAALAFCFGLSALAGLFGLSAAYGAFIAGLIIGNSTERLAMAEVTKPIQSILLMVFFLSIGLLVDLGYIWDNLVTVLLLFLMVLVFKTVLNVGVLRLLGQPWHVAFLAGVMLAQIGEFSFLLTIVGVDSGVIAADDIRLVVAVTVLSLAVSPLWVITARRMGKMAEAGRETFGGLMRLVYGREVEMVAGTVHDAGEWSMQLARQTSELIRRQEGESPAPSPAVEVEPPARPGASKVSTGKRRAAGKKTTGRKRNTKGP
jgi:CPA2 family monovalent cation:H+ antiporter-2